MTFYGLDDWFWEWFWAIFEPTPAWHDFKFGQLFIWVFYVSPICLKSHIIQANLAKFNNPNLAETPVPRVLQNESPTTNKRSSLPRSIAARRDKRKAPPPPNPFGEYDAEKADLYETVSIHYIDICQINLMVCTLYLYNMKYIGWYVYIRLILEIHRRVCIH